MSVIVVTVILLMLYLTMVIGQNKKSMPQIYIPRDCQDGNIDLIDADIIKHALLGTKGYTMLLSNEPVFIYELYKPENNNNNNDNNNTNNKT